MNDPITIFCQDLLDSKLYQTNNQYRRLVNDFFRLADDVTGAGPTAPGSPTPATPGTIPTPKQIIDTFNRNIRAFRGYKWLVDAIKRAGQSTEVIHASETMGGDSVAQLNINRLDSFKSFSDIWFLLLAYTSPRINMTGDPASDPASYAARCILDPVEPALSLVRSHVKSTTFTAVFSAAGVTPDGVVAGIKDIARMTWEMAVNNSGSKSSNVSGGSAGSPVSGGAFDESRIQSVITELASPSISSAARSKFTAIREVASKPTEANNAIQNTEGGAVNFLRSFSNGYGAMMRDSSSLIYGIRDPRLLNLIIDPRVVSQYAIDLMTAIMCLNFNVGGNQDPTVFKEGQRMISAPGSQWFYNIVSNTPSFGSAIQNSLRRLSMGVASTYGYISKQRAALIRSELLTSVKSKIVDPDLANAIESPIGLNNEVRKKQTMPSSMWQKIKGKIRPFTPGMAVNAGVMMKAASIIRKIANSNKTEADVVSDVIAEIEKWHSSGGYEAGSNPWEEPSTIGLASYIIWELGKIAFEIK